jgi:hypothetical protein
MGPEGTDLQQQQQQQLQFQQQVMDEQEEGALLSWVALVMMAAALAGVPPLADQASNSNSSIVGSGASAGVNRQGSNSSSGSAAEDLLARLSGGPQTQDSQRYLQGLKGFAAQAQQLYRSGYSLDRLTALQAAVSQVGVNQGTGLRTTNAGLPAVKSKDGWGASAQCLFNIPGPNHVLFLD